MGFFTWLITLCVGVYVCITWFIPKLLGWLLVRKFNIKLRFGRLSLPFSLRDVDICKDGWNIQIEEINVRSSFFSEVTKILSINIHGIRINNDVIERNVSPDDVGGAPRPRKPPLDFRNKKIPHSILTFAQFMAVHVYNLSVLMNNNFEPGWLLHGTISELHLDGSIVHNEKTLLVSVELVETQAKMLRHLPTKKTSFPNKMQPCMIEVSFGIALDCVLIAHGPFALEKLSVSTNNAKTVLHSGLFDFIVEAQHERDLKHAIVSYNQENKEDSSFTLSHYERIAPIIPKNFMIKVEDTVISAVRDNSSNDFLSKLHLLSISGKIDPFDPSTGASLPMFNAKVQVLQLEIDTMYDKILYIEEFSVGGEITDDIVNLYSNLKALQLFYNHNEVYGWIQKNFANQQRPAKSLSLNALEKSATITPTPSILEILFKKIVVKGTAEFSNISTIFKLNDELSAVTISHTRITLAQEDDIRSNQYDSQWANMILANRQWSTELMVESLWWSLGNMAREHTLNKKQHMKGSPFFLGMGIFRLSSYGDTTKLDTSVHVLRSEYSTPLANFVLQAIQCVGQYKKLRFSRMAKIRFEKAPKQSAWKSLLISTKIREVNIFLLNKHGCCIKTNLNEIVMTRHKASSAVEVSGLQLSLQDLNGHNGPTISLHGEQFLHLQMLRGEYVVGTSKSSKLVCQIVQDTTANWSPNLHMHILTFIQELQDYREQISPKRAKDESEQSQKFNVVFDFYANANTELTIKISESHKVQINLRQLAVNRRERLALHIHQALIIIDDMQIFSLKGVNVQHLHELKILQHERENYETFVQPSNSVWAVCLDEFQGIFPYDFDFSDAIQNEFITLFKWLKKTHKYQKKPFTADSPLPSDLIIQVKEFLLEMSDDPFEVKLRENYVLLMDEHFEAIKRKEVFDQKLQDICKGRLILPAGMVAELNATLVKKNSEIYIQRSKKIGEMPYRTRLIGWVLTDLEVMAMTDPSIHGAENVCHMMQDIDPESPWPEDGLEFVTHWCRAVSVSCTEWKFMLRDYPQPMFHVKAMHLFGFLCGAEQSPPRRAKRDVQIDLGAPFGIETLQRGMSPLKFYHDFDWELDYLCYAFGPCWEPVMAQCNLSFEKISAPSKDPSPVLPFWDKMRLLFHGRLTMLAKQYTILLHASLDPYNSTEEMELTWNNCGIVWTNAKIIFKGDLNVSVRTASRYDDCRLLHLPNLKLMFKLNWICLANPNDHHAVIPCAPDKLPEYSSNQVHDSYRAFRSQNVNISISFETRPAETDNDIPNLVLYGSTLRWFESLKLILSGVTRPTRRGPVFQNLRPRKKQLSRHYKKAHLQMSLHKFQIYYWLSHALNRGFQLNGGRVSLSSEHILSLNPIDDGLIHRPRADWDIVYMNCELNDAEIWLRTTLNEKSESSTSAEDNITMGGDICRDYFLSVNKVSYSREEVVQGDVSERSTPIHKLVVYDLKGAWTKNNRDVAFALFDSFIKAQKLKDNLGTDALKSFRKENTTPSKSRKQAGEMSMVATPSSEQDVLSVASGPAPSKQQTPHAMAMLQQLIAEKDHKSVVYSDDLSTQTREQNLKGLQAKQADDVITFNWCISLVNSQVLLKGCETSGYVILSAAKAEIQQKIHRPVWRDRTIVTKSTWIGLLECMQYYATVSAEDSDSREMSEIMWLSVDNIQEKDKDATVINEYPDVPHLVGSGQSVGGVVSECVGATGAGAAGGGVQLQRIVSRCKCEFFYVGYGDTSVDLKTVTEVPVPPVDETISPWEKQDDIVDAFTLMHYDLDISTNSLQYAMLLDIVNNLLLYVDPERKKALEKLARMRFQLQLYSSEDQKRPIQHLQMQIRNLMSQIRILEKDIHFIGKARIEEGDTEELRQEFEEVQKKIKEYKDRLVSWGDELDMMLSCYKETQLSASNKLAAVRKDKPLTIVRTNEICFKHAQWRLTEADGQIGIADLMLSNFLYTKNSKSDDSVEHLLELGYIRINNLIPRDQYGKVLCPTELQKEMPVEHKRVLRVFCREKPPVGGISLKEHFEINVVPITICISKKFYQKMLKFCFPDRDTTDADVGDDIDESTASTSSLASRASKRHVKKKKEEKKDSNFYVKIEKDDVEKMKERAEKNKLFIYIKIPEVPVKVSYKGSKEKNLEDINELSLVIPTLEYHNVTWTWLDLLLAMKTDSRKVLLSQAIKQKLKLRAPLSLVDEKHSPQEEDKAKMLFGNRHLSENRSMRRMVWQPPKP